MIKGEITYRSLLHYVCLVYFSVWMVIALVIVYNRFSVLTYGSVSGKAVLFSAFLMPPSVLYVLMKLQKDIEKPKDFLIRLFAPKKHLQAAAVTLIFCVALLLTAFLCGSLRHMELRMALLSILPVTFLSGFQETGFRGFLAEAFNREIPFVLAAVLTGTVWGALYFPLWFVEGAPWAELDFLLFLLNCVFQSILLNGLYLFTGSVFACIVFRSFWTLLILWFDGLMFDNGMYTICSCVEMVLISGIAAIHK